MNSPYALDKANAKMFGVCAGIANSTGMDVTAVRLIALALTFFLLGPVAVFLYLLTALVARSG